MPTHLKLIISTLALIAATLMFWLDSRWGTPGASRWVALGLGPLAVFSIWIFPEAKAREIRSEAAQRRGN